MKRGYLFFTTHDQDEISAYFIPETEEELIAKFNAVKFQFDMEQTNEVFNDWHTNHPDVLTFHIQSRCNEPWPFNGYDILGTFYHQVY